MKFFNRGEDHQHFSLRKLTVGVASVLLGTTFMIYGGRTVQASENDSANSVQTEQVQNSSAEQGTSEASKVNSSVKLNVNKETKVNDKTSLEVNTDNGTKQVVISKDQSNKAAEASERSDISKQVESKLTTQSDSKVTAQQENSEKEAVSAEKTAVSNDKTNAASAESNTQANANSNNDGHGEAVEITKDQVEEWFKLKGQDISAEDLAKLGLKPNEYLRDGIKYHVEADAKLTEMNSDKVIYTFKGLKAYHDANGDAHNSNDDYDMFEVMLNPYMNNKNVVYEVSYLPVVTGKTIYVNKGSKLTVDDAKRGLVDNAETDLKDAQGYQWDDTNPDYSVDVNKAGTYNGMVDVLYNIGGVGDRTHASISVNVKGNTIYVSKGDTIPTAPVIGGHGDITIDPTIEPKDITWTTKPSTSEVGVSTGIAVLTYPDGTKSNATKVTYIVSDPTGKTVHTIPGQLPDPSTVVTINPGDPSVVPGSKVTWTTTSPDVKTPGAKSTTVTVTYPDGHTKVVPGTVIVDTIETKNGVTKNVVRTIIDNVPGQTPVVTKQNVTFMRNEIWDTTLNKMISATPWTTDNAVWAAYQAKGAKGYQAQPASVASEKVNADTKDVTIQIRYISNGGQPVQPSTPDQPTNPVEPVQPTQPSIPDQPSVIPPKGQDVTPGKGTNKKNKKPITKKAINPKVQKSSKGSYAATHKTGSVYYPTVKAESAKPTSDRQALGKANKLLKKQAGVLPQTGNQDNTLAAAVGTALIAVSGLFSLAGRRKKRF